MATQVNYSTNPRSYAQLLATGVSPAQIREAINSGLNPAQLPPEYFGMTGGYTPQSVGPGAPQQIGGIDIPPASMNDPYAAPFMGSSAAGSYGAPAQASGSAGVGYPFSGSQASGSYGVLPTASLSGFPVVDFSTRGSASVGGPMSLGSYGGAQPTGLNIYGAPIDFSPLPSSDQFGWSPSNYSTPSSFDSTSYGAYSTGSGALPYSTPTPIPFSDSGSISAGGSMSLGGYEPYPFQAPGATSGVFDPLPTDYSSLGVSGSSPSAYNYYDAGGGTTYVYDSNWNYLGTQQSNPFTGATADASATYQSPSAGGTIGGAGATGGTVGSQGSWQNIGYGHGSPFGAGAAGVGGGGFGGYGGIGGSGAPVTGPINTGINDTSVFQRGGVDPTGDSGPPPGQGLEGIHSTMIGVSESAQARGGEANDAADAALMAARAAAAHQYPLTWAHWKNAFPQGSFSQRPGPNSLDPVTYQAGGWYPATYTTNPALQTTMPTSSRRG